MIFLPIKFMCKINTDITIQDIIKDFEEWLKNEHELNEVVSYNSFVVFDNHVRKKKFPKWTCLAFFYSGEFIFSSPDSSTIECRVLLKFDCRYLVYSVLFAMILGSFFYFKEGEYGFSMFCLILLLCAPVFIIINSYFSIKDKLLDATKRLESNHQKDFSDH